jgi:hypothetical protein
MRRRGWTLHELLISLGIMSGVIAIAAHAANVQLRFITDSGDLATLRNQMGHATTIAAAALWGVSPSGGDVVIATDSAIEVHVPIGTSFVCASSPGLVTMAAPSPGGNTLASFAEPPGDGVRVHALFEDSLGATWLTLAPMSAPMVGQGCVHFADVSQTLTFALREHITVPAGAPLRFTRPTRISIYRGSDRQWYIGIKDWNAELQQFNGIQPVAGPLRPYSSDPERTGLRFVYRDSEGTELPAPVDYRRIGSITVVARSTSARFEDSTAVILALRNAQ